MQNYTQNFKPLDVVGVDHPIDVSSKIRRVLSGFQQMLGPMGRQIEPELQELGRMLQEFAQSVAHDVSGPLIHQIVDRSFESSNTLMRGMLAGVAVASKHNNDQSGLDAAVSLMECFEPKERCDNP